MKFTIVTSVWVALPLMFLTSCAPDWGWDSPGNFYAQAGWTSARYDTAGFPIYGYYNNRPVYGYTAAGSPVFSFIELTRSCIVPNWKPAPHYRGNWQYPPLINRKPTPPARPQNAQPMPPNKLSSGIHGNVQPSRNPIGIKKNEPSSGPVHMQKPSNGNLPHRQENATRSNGGSHPNPNVKKPTNVTGMHQSNGGSISISQSHRKNSSPSQANRLPQSSQTQHNRPAVKATNHSPVKKP